MGQGYYLDRQGKYYSPVTAVSVPLFLLPTDLLPNPSRLSKTLNIFDVKHDSLPASLHTIYDVYRLATFITADKFWNSQIEQIYVNRQL